MKHKLIMIIMTVILAGGGMLLLPGLSYAEEAADNEESGQVAAPDEMAAPKTVGEEGMVPVGGSSVRDGVYSVEVESSSSMFRIVEAELTVQDGNMSAVITLSGKGYLKLFMGTGEEAVLADDSEYINYIEDSDGRYTYEIPVEALNKELECTAFSKRKEKWYDRTILFEAASLPEDALSAEPPEAVPVDLKDGAYRVEVILTGGSGRACVTSPAVMTVAGGRAEAAIEWSSPNYDYMKIGNTVYYPVNTEGNSAFEIPITVFDQEMAVIADTTAMSGPHEIEYMLTFRLASVKPDGDSRAPVIIIMIVVLLAAAGTGIVFYRKRKA